MPRLRRRIAVAAAASTALLVGPLALLVPSTASAGEATTAAAPTTSRDTRIWKCNGGRPNGDWQYMTIQHKFRLPANGTWKKNYQMDRWCLFTNPRAKLRIGWAKGTGSMPAMERRVRRARQAHDGFRLMKLHRLGAPFDDHTNRTAIAEFTFRGANGKRRHVRAVGDKYTVLIVRSSQKAWRNGVGKTAHRAHRSMSRFIGIAM